MEDLLKFVTCGSVDDGKSTLIGRLLFDTNNVYLDQKQNLIDKCNTNILDYSLLLDGLSAEQEQHITIDVAYRFFSTNKRRYIVADCPGHEEYTQNMAVGASFADIAVVLVTAQNGILPQTKRHIKICYLMGIRHYVLVVNKMDLSSFDYEIYRKISEEFDVLISKMEMCSSKVIPISATNGDNVAILSNNAPWYSGKTLIEHLDSIKIDNYNNRGRGILLIQRVCHSDGKRLYQGQMLDGMIQRGDKIEILPSKEKATIKEIYISGCESDFAMKMQPVSISLFEQVDISRGCVLTHNIKVDVSNNFFGKILWLSDQSLNAGENFILRCGSKTVHATIMSIEYEDTIDDERSFLLDTVYKNQIAYCGILLSEKMALDTFSRCKVLSEFILIDKISFTTVGCGIVEKITSHFEGLITDSFFTSRQLRAKQKWQNPITLWFTGLSASGKSTLANEIEHRLINMGKHTMILDGDEIRKTLNNDLGFGEADRNENIRRVTEVAKILNDAGLIVIVATISPFVLDRKYAKERLEDAYIEVFLSTPINICEKRDPKGLYKKARAGLIQNFTGIDSSYERPENPDIEIDTSKFTISESVEIIMSLLINVYKI